MRGCRSVFVYVFLIVQSYSALASDFATRLTQLEQDPKAAIASLAQHIEQSTNAEDWFLLSHGYLSLLNKDAAMSSVNKALELGLKPELEVAALQHKARIFGLLFRDTPSAVETLQLAEKHVQYLEHPNKPSLQSGIFESFAQAYNQLGQIPKAVTYADSAVSIAVANNLPHEELQARLIAGRLALQQNNYALAQQHLSSALLLAQDLKKTASLGSIHLRLGMAFHKLDQLPLALSHFQQAEQLFQMPERRNQLITVLLNKAQTLQLSGEVKQAAADLTVAMELAQQMNDPTMIAQAYYGQADLALHNKDFQQAEALLTKAQQLYTQIRSVTMATETALAQVDLALMQQNTDKAIAYFPDVADFKSLPLFLQEEFLKKKAKLHALQQQWQQAYEQIDLANQVRLQLDAEQQKQFIDPLQHSVRNNQLTNELQAEQAQRKRWQIGSLVTVTLLLLLMIGLLWRWPRKQSQFVCNWSEFSSTIQQLLVSKQPLQLQVIHGAALNADNACAIAKLCQNQQLVTACWHQQQLWLVWKDHTIDSIVAQAQRQIQQLQTLLTSNLFSWQGDLQWLMGPHIRPAALSGMSALVKFSWAQFPSSHASLVKVECQQAVPCNWLGENIPTDLQNALQLNLLTITQPSLPSSQTA